MPTGTSDRLVLRPVRQHIPPKWLAMEEEAGGMIDLMNGVIYRQEGTHFLLELIQNGCDTGDSFACCGHMATQTDAITFQTGKNLEQALATKIRWSSVGSELADQLSRTAETIRSLYSARSPDRSAPVDQRAYRVCVTRSGTPADLRDNS